MALNQELFKPQLSRTLSISSLAHLHSYPKPTTKIKKGCRCKYFSSPGRTTHWMTASSGQKNISRVLFSSLVAYSKYPDATIHEDGVRVIDRVADTRLCIISELTGLFLNIYHPCQTQGPVMETQNTKELPQTMPTASRLSMYPDAHGAYLMFI